VDQISGLVKPELLAVGGAMVIVYQTAWKVFLDTEALPTVPKWVIPLLMIPSGFVLAYAEHSIHPADPAATRMLADFWWVQGFFLVGVMLGGWVGASKIFENPAKESSPPAGENKQP
jgi:hypothetical protein